MSPADVSAGEGAQKLRGAEADKWLRRCTSDRWQQYSTDFERVRSNDVSSSRHRFLAGDSPPACPGGGAENPRVRLGVALIDFEGGSRYERWADVIQDPANSSNHVLRFTLGAPNVRNERGLATKGRVQLDVYGNTGVREMEISVRAKFSGAFTALSRHSDSFDWLMIAEWWNNPAWTWHKYPFRMSLNIVKDQPGAGHPLYFKIQAQTLDGKGRDTTFATVWAQTQKAFPVPLDKWMTLKYWIVEGNDTSGRFRMTVTPEGEQERVVFDIQGATHHPADPSPDGVSHFNPMKIYTSARLLKYVLSTGQPLTADWDDLAINVRDGQ